MRVDEPANEGFTRGSPAYHLSNRVSETCFIGRPHRRSKAFRSCCILRDSIRLAGQGGSVVSGYPGIHLCAYGRTCVISVGRVSFCGIVIVVLELYK